MKKNLANKQSNKWRDFSSENRQFAVVLILGILFSIVIVFMLWLQSHRSTDTQLSYVQPLETYVMEARGVSVDVKLLVDGVNSRGIQFPVDVVVYNLATENVVFDGVVVVTSDDDGVFGGTIPEVDFGGDDSVFDILIKGPKHRQVKFSSVLLSGVVFNLTDRPLPPGDLPWNNGEQDKVVNMNDYDALVSRIGSDDPIDLLIADLDFNGVINDLDRSLMLKTLASQ